MTIGTSFSLWRLRKLGIFCISPPRVNVSGRVNVMVLDKTGTLTEDGLQVYGFRRLKGADVNTLEGAAGGKPAVEFDRFHEQIEFLTPEDHGAEYFLNNQSYNQCKNRQSIKLLEAMGSCH
jgi:P-type E1-E2 ATPase